MGPPQRKGHDVDSIDNARRDLLRWVSAGASAWLAACGGGTEEAPAAAGVGGSGGGGTSPPVTPPVTPPATPPVTPPVAPPVEPTTAFSRPGQGAAGTPVTPAQRATSLQALESRLSELWDFSSGQASAGAVLDWLSARPEFKTVGYSTTRDVYAIYTDGRPLLVATRLRTTTEGVRKKPLQAPQNSATQRRRFSAASPLAAHDARTRASTAAAITDYDAGIPSRQFRFMNTWYDYGPDWPADTWARGTTTHPAGVASMQDPSMVADRMVDFGYQKVAFLAEPDGINTAPSVEGLKSVTGDGIFYWMTHGGTLSADGQLIQALMTGTPAYKSTVEDTYKDEFAEGTLIYCTGPLCLDKLQCKVSRGIDGEVFTRLAITPKWITKYRWRFSQHSLVFVNACSSGTGPMKQAFLDAGASLYLGWTAPVRAWALCGATVDVFSLLMGFNENNGSTEGEISPLQRPYDWGAVFDMLNTDGKSEAVAYWDAEDGYVELEPTLNPNVAVGFLGLRPSIFQSAFNEESSELTLIGGVFGTQGGSAAIGTDQRCVGGIVACTSFGSVGDHPLADPLPLTVVDWKSSNVILTLPVDGVGSQGLVQLTVDGRWSNLLQLTRIRLPVRGTLTDGGSLQLSIQGELSFRCDLRGIRLQPLEPLRYAPMVVVSSAVAAQVNWQASGIYRYTEGQSTVTVEWSGAGKAQNRSAAGERALLVGTLDPQARTGALAAFFELVIDEKVTRSSPGLPDSVRLSKRSLSLNAEPAVAGQPFPVQPAFAPDYTAPAVSFRASRTAAGHNQSGQRTVLDLGPFSSQFPPSDSIGGR